MTRICTTNQPSQALSRLFLGEAAMVSLEFSNEQSTKSFDCVQGGDRDERA